MSQNHTASLADTPTVKDNAVFSGLEQCATTTGISMEMLRRAKAHPDSVDGSNGFSVSGRIYWAKLKPWLKENGEDLVEGNADDYFRWRSIKMEYAAKNEQMEYEKTKERLVERIEVHALLRRIAAAQSSLLNSRFRQELVSKLEGLSEPQRQILVDQAISDFMVVLTKELKGWG